jgi:hypothetical protein
MPLRRTKCINVKTAGVSTADAKVVSTVRRRLLNRTSDVEAIVLMGSTAFKPQFTDWDDFDVRVYTRSKSARSSYYELLTDSGRHYLLSAYYYQLDLSNHPARSVTSQDDVQILFGRKESLRHIFVDRPQRMEPLPHDLPKFVDTHYERYFEILVDIFFILNRCEMRGKTNAIKARIAREGLQLLSRCFFEFYAVKRTIPRRERWRNLMFEVIDLLNEREFANRCQNKEFVRAAIELIMLRALD